ncbi:MAG: VOC family protein [Candidatus Bathyarchaeia archaeon]|jgi:catechol 2,3-dioxygenase-like lactoylglutathione lyase family enzyme
MKFNPLKPELYVTSFQISLNFYKNILGFDVEYQRENPSFAFLSYQGSNLMIQELDPKEDKAFITGSLEYPLGRGINFQIDIDNISKISNSLKRSKYPLRRNVQDSWYKVGNILHGCRQILVQDPDGYLLRFSQGIGEKPVE